MCFLIAAFCSRPTDVTPIQLSRERGMGRVLRLLLIPSVCNLYKSNFLS